MAIKPIQREEVFKKLHGHCAYCGEALKSIKQMQVDHIIPQAFFVGYVRSKIYVPQFLEHLTECDVDHIDNLHPACGVCNKWKSTFHLELFRSEIADQIKRLNDYSSNFRLAKRYGIVQETPQPIVFYFEGRTRN